MNRLARRNRRTAFAVLAVAAGMVGLAYAAVPFYQVFCKATGYGGTTQRAVAAPGQLAERVVTVRFNSDVAGDLPWRFAPEQRAVEVHLGEVKLAYFRAENRSDRPITGVAAFNVTPDKAGVYFDKIACFCFSQQTLQPGQKVDMPVSFFVDPKMLKDRNLDEVSEITLSYTFFLAPDQPTKLSAAEAPAGTKAAK
jgi:cytochrome c oxidase assembly protein subunit 11